MGRRSATLSAMSATVPKLARARRLSRTSTKGGPPVRFWPLNEYIRKPNVTANTKWTGRCR